MKALLLDAWRGLVSRRASMGVAAGGLMVAMTVCLLVALLAIAFAAPDPAIPDPERVVVLDFKGNIPGQPSPWFTAAPAAFATMLKERHAPLDLISRAMPEGIDIEMHGRVHPTFLLIVDPDLVPLLGLRALHGDLPATLVRHDGIAITEQVVRNLWGELPAAQALNRRIESQGLFYTVTAIIPDFDPRSPIGEASPMVGAAKAMVGYRTQGNRAGESTEIYAVTGRVFARLRPGGSVDPVGGWMREAFVANPRYLELPAEWRTNREAAFFRGIKLTQLPFEGARNEPRWRLLGGVAAASALLLLLAAFNCMNLQTANLLLRQRETALRRSLGADGSRLLALWGTEVLISLLLAAAGAVLLAWLFAPVVAGWIGLPAGYQVGDPFPLLAVAGLGVTVLVLLVLVLAPPAWRALRRIPAQALQGRTVSEGPWGRRTRQMLLTFQLAGAVALLVLAGVLAAQQRYLLDADRGFDTRNRIWLGFMVNPEKIPNLDAFTAALGRHPTIEGWAFSNGRPAAEDQGGIDMYVGAANHKQVLRLTDVSPGFFATYGMTMLAGEPRVSNGETSIVIDAKAARALGFDTPQSAVGALVRGGSGYLQEGNEPRRIVGVIKDVKQESARAQAMPQGFVLTDAPQWDIHVHGRDMKGLRETVSALWKQYGPDLPYMIESADEQRASVYSQEQQMTTMLTAIALLAVGVAMLGAYALVSDSLRRRRTELVLHRLHGAGNAAIVRVVSAEFAAPLLLAAVIGLPAGFWLGRRYLAGFVDRVDVSAGIVMPMVVASVAIVLVVVVSALRHVRQALTLQPAEALR